MAQGGTVNETIHSSDEMYAVMQTHGMGPRAYLQSGVNNLGVFRELIAEHGPGALESPRVLDHGCGYGRLTRHYEAQYGARSVAAADVTMEMISFCEEQFGATPILTGGAHRITAADRIFDIIISVSVFSHLPLELLRETMKDLASVLDQDGILVLTAAGEAVAAVHNVEIGAEGCFYGPIGATADNRNETHGRLDTDVYSSMFVTPPFMNTMLREAGLENLEFVPKGHVGRQDIYVVAHRR